MWFSVIAWSVGADLLKLVSNPPPPPPGTCVFLIGYVVFRHLKCTMTSFVISTEEININIQTKASTGNTKC